MHMGIQLNVQYVLYTYIATYVRDKYDGRSSEKNVKCLTISENGQSKCLIKTSNIVLCSYALLRNLVFTFIHI